MTRSIATSSDAVYFPALMALLRSLRRTNPRIPVTVFDGGLTPSQAARAGRYAEVIPRTPFLEIENTGKFSYIGNATLLKFEVAEIESEKVLYLDCDTIVLEGLDSLFSFPEGMVGVVKEVNAVKNMFRPRDRDRLRQDIDIDWEGPGFNAGVFALRPGEWPDIKERAYDLIDRFGPGVFSKSKDQQLLNIIFSGKTFDFPGRYNFSPLYDEGEGGDPAVIHYLTQCKPWHYDYPPGHRYEEFRRHLSVTDFPAILAVDMARGTKHRGRRVRPKGCP